MQAYHACMNKKATPQAPQTSRSGLRNVSLVSVPSPSNCEPTPITAYAEQTSTVQTVNANAISAKQMLASLSARRQRLYGAARVDSYEFTGIAG